MRSPSVFLGLGSNLGDRELSLERGLASLESRGFQVICRSSTYLTEPVGGPAQDWFLNAVVGGETELTPDALLEACLEVEAELGRVRRVPNGPRTLDLDLLLYGSEVRHDERLSLPHPRFHERRFVLVPLAEIAPALCHPLLGSSVQELLERCPDASRVVRAAADLRLPR
jgi:2-amino-4-hydroxy-6-hydroxymethyldihydropteridine diphosphokinase